MLTEAEVQRSFRKIFNLPNIDQTSFDRAEALLDELRPESPLRFKMSQEIEELKKIHLAEISG